VGVRRAAAGLAVAVLAVGRRAEVTASNTFAYLVIAAGGLVVANDKAPVLDRLGRVLPLSNGVDAVRALLEGRPWVGHLVAEVAVGAVWLVAAVLLLRWQDQRARRAGLDDYT
jgi:ABC-2 type transport system permease protein